nr:deleted in lung and esophageal cancer protein 1 [Hymenolepis microstoma]
MRYFLLIGRYPNVGSASIAPGLSCKLIVTPYNISNQVEFDETLLVYSDLHQEPIKVQLAIKKLEKRISYPKTVNMGRCLVDSSLNQSLQIKLLSAPNARIRIQSELSGFFVISPNEFDISSQKPEKVQVTFCPDVEGEFSEVFQVMIADSVVGEIVCQCYSEKLRVSLKEESDKSFWITKRKIDSYGCMTVFCNLPEIHPNFRINQKFMLVNEGNVSLQLQLEENDPISEQNSSKFNVSMEKMILPSKGSVKFTVSFCSEKLGRHKGQFTICGAQLTGTSICEHVFGVLKFHATVTVISPTINVFPDVITLQKPLVLFETTRLKVNVSNSSSNCPINFEWISPNQNDELNLNDTTQDIIIYPESGRLSPLETKPIMISLTPKVLGQLNCILNCIPNASSKYGAHLRVFGEISSPSLELENECIDFGILCPNRTIMKTTYIKNPSCATLKWVSYLSQETELAFKIEPSGGLLKPKCLQKISITFHSQLADRFYDEVNFMVESGPLKTLKLIGEVKESNILMDPQEMQIDGLYVNDPYTFYIEMQNTSDVQSKFYWKKVADTNLNFVRVILAPTMGLIEPKQSIMVQVNVVALELKNINEYKLQCEVEGISKLIDFKISATVRGVSCKITKLPNAFSVEDDENQEELDSVTLSHSIFEIDGPTIEFPKMGLRMPREAYLAIENASKIPTVFNLQLENFPAECNKSWDILKSKDEDWRMQNIQTYKFCQQLLKSEKTAAILIEKGSDKFTLTAYERKIIRLICCADIFGEFHDTLTVTAEPFQEYYGGSQSLVAKLPVIARVFGSPVEFLAATKSVNKMLFNQCLKDPETESEFYDLMLSSIPARELLVNFGSISVFDGAKKREVKLRNNSGCTVIVDWHLYEKEREEKCGKFLDLCAHINEPSFTNQKELALTDVCNSKVQISLLLRPHEGYLISRSPGTRGKLIEKKVENKYGIMLSPMHIEIPPHREASVFISINTKHASVVEKACIEAYAQGFISIKNELRNVHFPDSLLCPQIRLNLKAKLMPP